jgi:hypothetical protein
MHEIQDKTIEVVLSSAIAFVGFFTKRTFNAYDEKLVKLEVRHEDILHLLNKIDKDVVRLNTLMETDEWKKQR